MKCLYLFQSTLPQGERRSNNFRRFLLCHFNPRSHKGSDLSSRSVSTGAGYFNPRSHKGSDKVIRELCTHVIISIHAPTRGATMLQVIKACDLIISIHAPTRGATGLLAMKSVIFEFQSTLPQGERHSEWYV